MTNRVKIRNVVGEIVTTYRQGGANVKRKAEDMRGVGLPSSKILTNISVVYLKMRWLMDENMRNTPTVSRISICLKPAS